MDNIPHKALVVAYRLDGHGYGEPLSEAQIKECWHDEKEMLWMHFDLAAPNIEHYLASVAELDSAQCEAMCEEAPRPRVAHFGQGMLTTLRGINTAPESDYDDLVSLRVFLSSRHLVTLRRRPLAPIQDIREQLAQSVGPKSVTELLGALADRIVDQMGDRFTALDEELSRLEEHQLDQDELDSDALAELRRPLITLRRFMEPQYACLSRLAEATPGLENTTRLALRESANQLYRYIEDVRAMQERALILQEQTWNAHNEQLNERLYQLSFISVLFLPLTFLTGLLGINVGGMPGASDPHAFWVVVGLCVALTIGLMVMMKRWR